MYNPEYNTWIYYTMAGPEWYNPERKGAACEENDRSRPRRAPGLLHESFSRDDTAAFTRHGCGGRGATSPPYLPCVCLYFISGPRTRTCETITGA